MAPQLVDAITNQLVTPEQITQSASILDGLSADLCDAVRYQGSLLTQSAGILLRLSQDIIGQAVVTLIRFYLGHEGGSYRVHAIKDISAAAIYLTAKTSTTPVSPRSVLNVYAYLLASKSPLNRTNTSFDEDPHDHSLTEGQYQHALLNIQKSEATVLKTLSYQTRTILPHGLALTYLSTFGALPAGEPNSSSKALASRTLELLNTALLSPQLLYVTHQPHVLAISAIYLAARQCNVRLAGEDSGAWWEIFDVDREELGFVVVAMLSLPGWVTKHNEDRERLLTLGEVESAAQNV